MVEPKETCVNNSDDFKKALVTEATGVGCGKGKQHAFVLGIHRRGSQKLKYSRNQQGQSNPDDQT